MAVPACGQSGSEACQQFPNRVVCILHAEAQESGDAWAVAALQWMLGHLAGALQALLPAGADPDPVIYPVLGCQPASPDAARLDFVRYCAGAAAPLMAAAAGAAAALAQAADRAAAALSTHGLPAMALEAATLADALSAGSGQGSGSEWRPEAVAVRDKATRAQRARLAAAALLWAALGAQAPRPDPGTGSGQGPLPGGRLARLVSGTAAGPQGDAPKPWRAAAEQSLAALAGAGLAGVDAAAALEELEGMRAALLAPAAEAGPEAHVPETPRTPASVSGQSLGYARRRCMRMSTLVWFQACSCASSILWLARARRRIVSLARAMRKSAGSGVPPSHYGH